MKKCEHPDCDNDAKYRLIACGTFVCWDHRKWTKGYTIRAEEWNKMILEWLL